MKRKLVSILLAVAMVSALIPQGAVWATAAENGGCDEIVYLAYDNAAKGMVTKYSGKCTPVTNDTVLLTAGWYVVKGEITTGRVTAEGDVNVILEDESKWQANGGIVVDEGGSLSVYAQSEDEARMGKLIADGGYNPGINTTEGELTVHGGNIEASGCPGIGGGKDISGASVKTYNNSVVTINGGFVTARSNGYAAGIGGSMTMAGGTVVINGGFVRAYGAGTGPGIGTGAYPMESDSANTVIINGGEVMAYGSDMAAGIGGGNSGYGVTVTINGGNVTAIGGNNAAGIGGGAYNSEDGTLTVNGGKVYAKGGNNGAGIGGGFGGETGGEFILNGGEVTAIGGEGAAGVGGGASQGYNNSQGYSYIGGKGSKVTIAGGTLKVTGGLNAPAIGDGVSYNKTEKYAGPGSTLLLIGGTVIAEIGKDPTLIFDCIESVTTLADGASLYDYGTQKVLSPSMISSLFTKSGVSFVVLSNIREIEYLSHNDDTNRFDTKTCAEYQCVPDTTGAWGNGWYAAKGIFTVDGDITVNGNACLILTDGSELTVTGKITVQEGNTLTVYRESNGKAGTLTVGGINGGGLLIIHGGIIDAVGIETDVTILGGKIGSDSAFGGNVLVPYGVFVTDENTGKIIEKSDGQTWAEAIGDGAFRISAIQSPVGYYAYGDTKTQLLCTDYRFVTAKDTAWSEGWYVVDRDIEITNIVSVTGSVHLILKDECTLTVSVYGIRVNEGNTFSVYAQSDGGKAGNLTVNATVRFGAGIGSASGINAGRIDIHGGNITSTGGENSAGIGGGSYSMSGNGSIGADLTVYGGRVVANGGKYGAGIGGGYLGSGKKTVILGGTVEAFGGSIGTPGIGAGYHGVSGGELAVRGGTVEVFGGNGCDAVVSDKVTVIPEEGISTFTVTGNNKTALSGSPFASGTDITELTENQKRTAHLHPYTYFRRMAEQGRRYAFQRMFRMRLLYRA